MERYRWKQTRKEQRLQLQDRNIHTVHKLLLQCHHLLEEIGEHTYVEVPENNPKGHRSMPGHKLLLGWKCKPLDKGILMGKSKQELVE